MRNSKSDGPLTPEEFHKRMQEFMKGFKGSESTFFTPPASGEGDEAPEPSKEDKKTPSNDDIFQFDYKPKGVKDYLDRFVIKQETAKKVLSVALCDHYHHARMALEGKDVKNYAKQNVILVGPTGVGKTYLIRSMAELIGVPFVKADATKFSETGYVGGDVEDLVRDLVRKADGDVRRAEFGIIYIDEIDKLSSPGNAGGRDVSGRGVQTNLLKLMEETEVPARAPNDIQSQIQAMMSLTGDNKKQPSTINTRHILFVVSGAFDGLEKITSKRLRDATIGFATGFNEKPDVPEEILEAAQTKDFIEYGFEPEFIGRLPVRVTCHSLKADDLFEILKSSEGSIIRQYEQSFAAYGIEVLFKESGLRKIAALAAEEKTGARGLMTVCERLFRELKFELPSSEVRQFEVTEELVDNPVEALHQLLAESRKQERAILRSVVEEFAERFKERHGLIIRFTDVAAERLAEMALEKQKPVRDHCAEVFKDYQFGLKLVSQNTGRTEFELGEESVQDPDKFLSELVVKSYKEGQSNPSAAE